MHGALRGALAQICLPLAMVYRASTTPSVRLGGLVEASVSRAESGARGAAGRRLMRERPGHTRRTRQNRVSFPSLSHFFLFPEFCSVSDPENEVFLLEAQSMALFLFICFNLHFVILIFLFEMKL